MSAEYERLINDVNLHTPGALTTAIEAELFSVLRDFLQNTNIWWRDYDIEVRRGERCYMVHPGAGVVLKNLMVLYNRDDQFKRWVAPATMATPGAILLSCVPSQDHEWVARITLSVADVNTTECKQLVPSWILNVWYNTLQDGVLGRMLAHPAKPYTNNALALYHMRQYNKGRAECRAAVVKQNVYGGQSWMFPQGGVTHGRQRGV